MRFGLRDTSNIVAKSSVSLIGCSWPVARRRSRYQRGGRRPPPPPPPPRDEPPPPPPPKPPLRGAFGRASLTVRLRPPSSVSFKSRIAACAPSSVLISTKANPRARPVA